MPYIDGFAEINRLSLYEIFRSGSTDGSAATFGIDFLRVVLTTFGRAGALRVRNAYDILEDVADMKFRPSAVRIGVALAGFGVLVHAATVFVLFALPQRFLAEAVARVSRCVVSADRHGRREPRVLRSTASRGGRRILPRTHRGGDPRGGRRRIHRWWRRVRYRNRTRKLDGNGGFAAPVRDGVRRSVCPSLRTVRGSGAVRCPRRDVHRPGPAAGVRRVRYE